MGADSESAVRDAIARVARGALWLAAIALLLLAAVTVYVGLQEYPLFSLPGLRFLLQEAAPPALVAALALASARRVRGPHPRTVAARWMAVLGLGIFLVRALLRLSRGGPPASWIEAVLFAAILLAALVVHYTDRPDAEQDRSGRSATTTK